MFKLQVGSSFYQLVTNEQLEIKLSKIEYDN